MKPPKHYPELPIGNDHERGTPTTFIRALVNVGFDFQEIVAFNKEWVDRLKDAK